MRRRFNSEMVSSLKPKLEKLGFSLFTKEEDGPFGSAYWEFHKGEKRIRTIWDGREQSLDYQVSKGNSGPKTSEFETIDPEFEISPVHSVVSESELIQQMQKFEKILFRILDESASGPFETQVE